MKAYFDEIGPVSVLLARLEARGAPTELMAVGVGVEGIASNEAIADAVVSGEAVSDGIVFDEMAEIVVVGGEIAVKLRGWLALGQVTLSAQGSMEQQP